MKFLQKLVLFIKHRFKEKSTARGFIASLTVFGLTLTPEQTEQIISLGVLAISLFEMVIPDNGETDIQEAIKKDNTKINFELERNDK
ncbi:MAG: hypothetical protein ACOC2W_03685 [bacterium]